MASSSVWPAIGGSSPLTFIRSSKEAMVFQRPELRRMAGIPSRAARSMQCFVCSMSFCRSAASGETKSWWMESMGRAMPLRKASLFKPFR